MGDSQSMRVAESRNRVPDVVVITGMSGSGRTQALHVFEDMGYFCIDNLPPRLILQLTELVGINSGVGRHLAVTCDLRSQGLFDEITESLSQLREHELSCQVVFLDTSDEVLMRRYDENRRRHPLAKPGESLASAISRERAQLSVSCAHRPCAPACAARSRSSPTSSSWRSRSSRLASSTACPWRPTS